MVNDKDVFEKAGRGFNVAVLAGQNHEVVSTNVYDTFASEKASKQMIEDFNTVPVGSVYIAAIKDEGSRKLTAEAKEIF